MDSVSTLFSGIQYGYLVAKHITISMCLLPSLVLYKGPTMSQAILSYGTNMIGVVTMGGALGWTILPAFWHSGHAAQKSLTSLRNPGQIKLPLQIAHHFIMGKGRVKYVSPPRGGHYNPRKLSS